MQNIQSRKYQPTLQYVLKISLAAAWVLFLISCNRGEVQPKATGSIWFIVNPKVGTAPVELNSPFTYENEAGNKFRISKFRQYISQIKLYEEGGAVVEIPMTASKEGVYLIDAADRDSYTFELSNVPEGNYNRISFVVGLDLSKLEGIVATGILSQSGEMYLGANTGYLHWVFEGSYEASLTENLPLVFQAAGAQTLHEANIPFGSDIARVRTESSPVVELNADLGQLFTSPHLIDFAVTQQLNITQTPQMAEQFAKGINYDHLHN